MIPEELKPFHAQLVAKVHAPVFFQKLASYGIHAQTPADEEALLKLAGLIQNAEVHDRIQASTNPQPSIFTKMAGELENWMTQSGYPTVERGPSEGQIKAAAAELAADKELEEAALQWARFNAQVGN